MAKTPKYIEVYQVGFDVALPHNISYNKFLSQFKEKVAPQIDKTKGVRVLNPFVFPLDFFKLYNDLTDDYATDYPESQQFKNQKVIQFPVDMAVTKDFKYNKGWRGNDIEQFAEEVIANYIEKYTKGVVLNGVFHGEDITEYFTRDFGYIYKYLTGQPSEYEKTLKRLNMSPLDKWVEFVERESSWFDMEYYSHSPTQITLLTRHNAECSGGRCQYGEEDLKKANQIKERIKKKYPKTHIQIQANDDEEYVVIHLELPKGKYNKGGALKKYVKEKGKESILDIIKPNPDAQELQPGEKLPMQVGRTAELNRRSIVENIRALKDDPRGFIEEQKTGFGDNKASFDRVIDDKKAKVNKYVSPETQETVLSMGTRGILAKGGEIKTKLKEKLDLAKTAIDKWGGDNYQNTYNEVEKYYKKGTLPDYSDYSSLLVQGGEPKDNYTIFQGYNAFYLAEKVREVIEKYKKYEVKESSTGAAGGWSGTMRSTISGYIKGEANFSPGRRYYLIGVKCGGGVNREIRKKLFNELYPLFFKYDEYNGTDGGVRVDLSEGTNYHTFGLVSDKYSFNRETAEKLNKILAGESYEYGGKIYGSAYQDEVEDRIKDLSGDEYEVFAFDNNIDPEDANEMSNFISDLDQDEAEKIINQLKGEDYAKGGRTFETKNDLYNSGDYNNVNSLSADINKYFNELEKDLGKDYADEMRGEVIKDIKNPKEFYAKGGMIDYFEEYELLQKEYPKIYEVVFEQGELTDYKDTERLLKKLNSMGWTFDYGLDNSPYNLRPFAPKMNWPNYKKGGLTSKKARKMLKDGMAQGKPLTAKQKRYFGALASGKEDKIRKRARMKKGGRVNVDKFMPILPLSEKETILKDIAFLENELTKTEDILKHTAIGILLKNKKKKVEK